VHRYVYCINVHQPASAGRKLSGIYNRSNNLTAAIKPDSHDRQTDRRQCAAVWVITGSTSVMPDRRNLIAATDSRETTWRI